ncbi:MAG TPA: formate/nitrite transporter family protein [Candidatus Acidoferrum sp.]|jgi:formate transporter|nr:formate/nitrite transporter family protein [Candidatus Acidoferrum sp.]
MTDYVTPKELVREAVDLAARKADLSVKDMLIRGALSGAFLGFATSLVFTVNSQGLPPVVGAILFPVGFVILVLLGLELATGNFAILPVGLFAGNAKLPRLLRNWMWVYVGNLIGSLLFVALFCVAITNFRTGNGGPVAELLKQAALKKTVGYAALGGSGWGTAFVKAILCNWMVTIGSFMALVSRSTLGKIAAMWLPSMTFFALGFEHSIVNMFVIPSGMVLGAPISLAQFLLWNLVLVTLGNIVAGAFFTGAALYATYPTAPKHIDLSTPATATLATDPQPAFATAPAATLNPM